MANVRAVPRPKSSENLTLISVNVPGDWLDRLDELAKKMDEAAGSSGSVTRSHALRAAIRRGLDSLAAEFAKTKPRR